MNEYEGATIIRLGETVLKEVGEVSGLVIGSKGEILGYFKTADGINGNIGFSRMPDETPAEWMNRLANYPTRINGNRLNGNESSALFKTCG